MPTIMRIDGLRVVIWPNDHRPAHVHVIGPNAEAIFNLRCPDGPPVLRDNLGFRLAEIRGIADRLTNAIGDLCGNWEGIHGDYGD